MRDFFNNMLKTAVPMTNCPYTQMFDEIYIRRIYVSLHSYNLKIRYTYHI